MSEGSERRKTIFLIPQPCCTPACARCSFAQHRRRCICFAGAKASLSQSMYLV